MDYWNSLGAVELIPVGSYAMNILQKEEDTWDLKSSFVLAEST